MSLAITDSGLLYFGRNNSKLVDLPIATFSLPAGTTCPGAKDCFAYFDRNLRKLVDGKHQKYRCFAASIEAARPSVRISTDRNLLLLKNAKNVSRMATVIHTSLPPSYFDMIRIHVDGDFYSRDYMLAWMEVARRNPDRLFYAYTKSLPYWVDIREAIPSNFVFTASRGGKFDAWIDKYNLREAVVVFHPDEAERMGLQIDHTDSLARDPAVQKFALLLHGPQPTGTPAAAALGRMRKEKVQYSYGRKK